MGPVGGGVIPPSLGSRAPAGCWCGFPGGQPGSRSAGPPFPWRSRRRQSCLLDGRGSNAGPGALGAEMSFYLRQEEMNETLLFSVLVAMQDNYQNIKCIHNCDLAPRGSFLIE